MKCLIPLGCLVLAAYFIVLNHDGWGWCLFVALLTSDCSNDCDCNCDEEEENDENDED